jgi:hypothetical protein
MSDHERNELCVNEINRLRKDVDKHIEDAPKFRDSVVKHDTQILTLEKAHENTMKDISDIKETLSDMKEDIKDLGGDVKLWVLSGIASTVIVFAIPTLTLFYNAGQMSKQVDINTKKWEMMDSKLSVVDRK